MNIPSALADWNWLNPLMLTAALITGGCSASAPIEPAAIEIAMEEPAKNEAASIDSSMIDPTKLAAAVKDILRSRCFDCHGGTATQGDISVLNHAELVSKKYIVPGKPDDSSLYQMIIESDEDVRMPKNSPPLSANELETIRQWILSSAPKFPDDVVQPKETVQEDLFKSVKGVEYVLQEILNHQRKLANDERRFVRYFSCNHLLTAGATRETIDAQRDAFAKAINHLSWEKEIVKPTVVNGETGTIFAIDIRRLGWHKQPFEEIVGDLSQADETNLYDLVLLEYPYGILYQDSLSFDALLTEYMSPARLIRPIPYVRTDWFCSATTLPPLYHDLLGLPRTLTELEKMLGVDSAANLAQHTAKRAGMTISGVSRNNRAVERHPFAHGAYWKSIDYASSKGAENIFIDPVNLRGTGGEMIFQLPNGLQAYYISNFQGARLDDAPTSIVTDKFAEDKTVRNGLSCMRCHDRGMKEFRDDVRPAVEGLKGSGKINKREVLALYPTYQEMTALVEQDRQRFLGAMKQVLGTTQTTEPLIGVTQRFLDAPLQVATVAGELGLVDANNLKTIFRQPNFASFGLFALGNKGVIRRDMWEDYFDQIVRALGIGVPVLPIDGNTRSDYLPADSPLDVTISTDKKNNVFAPGDELVIFIENNGRDTVFVELIGTGTKGEKVVLVPSGTKVKPGTKLRFPEKGGLKVQKNIGRELITVFASDKVFPAGKILRAKNIDDRLVHPFYKMTINNGSAKVLDDAFMMIKRTIVIETTANEIR